MPNVNLSPYSAEQESLNRRRKIAEALQAQSMAPIELPQVAGAKVSHLQGLSQLAKALMGGFQNRRLDKQQTALDENVAGERNASAQAMVQALAGKPLEGENEQARRARLTAMAAGLAQGDPLAQVQLQEALAQQKEARTVQQRMAEALEERNYQRAQATAGRDFTNLQNDANRAAAAQNQNIDPLGEAGVEAQIQIAQGRPQSTASTQINTPFELWIRNNPTRSYEDWIEASSKEGGQRPLTQTSEAGLIDKLSKQWTAATKPAVEIDRQLKLMDAGMDAARKGNLAQGSQMVLVTFQKILDPPSVVREAEFDRSAAGQSIKNRVKGAYERMTVGGAGIPLEELEKFAQLAKEAAKAQSTGYLQSVKKRIGVVAKRYSIPEEAVFEDFQFGADPAPAPTTGAGGWSVKVKP